MNRDGFVSTCVLPGLNRLRFELKGDYTLTAHHMARLDGLIEGAYLCGVFTFQERHCLLLLVYSAFRNSNSPVTFKAVA